jgi:hypothetical protein
LEVALRLEPVAPDLGGKHRAEPVSPVSQGFVADLGATHVQQVFDIAKRQREADDLRARFDATERGAPCPC